MSDSMDGFGTAELTVGIRAYQWGWEYYYPRSIDLNYSVKDSYSAFIGKSLRYNQAPEQSLRSNQLWRFYQGKQSDNTVTPAHLLLIPSDNKNLVNFTDFNDIGSNKLKESSSFKKIFVSSKTLTSNLVNITESFLSKYKQLNNSYLTDSSFNLTNNYGLIRQHNLLNLKSINNDLVNVLDKDIFNLFLKFNKFNNKSTINNFEIYKSFLGSGSGLNINLLPYKVNLFNLNNFSLTNYFYYPTFELKMNNNSDKSFMNFPIKKLFNKYITQEKFNN